MLIAAVFLVFSACMLWIVFFVVEFTAILSARVLLLALALLLVVHALSFVPFWLLLSESDMAWALLAALGLGGMVLGRLVKSAKRVFRLEHAR